VYTNCELSLEQVGESEARDKTATETKKKGSREKRNLPLACMLNPPSPSGKKEDLLMKGGESDWPKKIRKKGSENWGKARGKGGKKNSRMTAISLKVLYPGLGGGCPSDEREGGEKESGSLHATCGKQVRKSIKSSVEKEKQGAC